ARFYDISNLSATYAFTETYIRDFNTEYNFIRNYRGALAYSYSTSPKSYEPLSKIGFLKKSKYLRLIRDFNFTLVPKQVAINNNFDRRYSERKIRNLNPEATLEQPPFVDKAFNWNRTYNLSYDLSKSIKIDFSANTRALIREFEGEQVLKGDGDDAGKGGYELNPDGTIRYETESYELHRDSILTSLKEFGLTTDYNHNASVSYSVPLNKIPFLDWTNVSARYTGNYEWRRGPLIDPQVRKENIERGVGYRGDTLGHTVSNGQQLQLNTTLNLLSLYNKVPYLRDVNRGKPKRNVRNVQDQKKKKGEGIGAVEEEEEEEDDEKDLKVLNGFLKVLMSVKNVSGTYSLNRGITLPGFKHEATYLGMDPGAVMAPGMGFAFGQQRNFGD
ncbi:MAG: cell surface protein SprA, partial [Salibacteraceae bacterium]